MAERDGEPKAASGRGRFLRRGEPDFPHCWNDIAKDRVREAILKPAETFLRQAAPLGTLTGVAVMYYTPDGEFQMYVQDGAVLFDRADIQVCSVPAAW